MYHIELEKCKQLTPSTSKSINSFRRYDTLKIRGQNWNGKIILFYKNQTFLGQTVNVCVRQTFRRRIWKFHMKKPWIICFHRKKLVVIMINSLGAIKVSHLPFRSEDSVQSISLLTSFRVPKILPFRTRIH